MNIIFGDAVEQLPKGYIVLELDTVRLMPHDKKIKTYCAIEKLTMEEFVNLEKNKFFHVRLLEQYRQQNWPECKDILTSLKGCWNGELDTFYNNIEQRINEFSTTPPPPNWDGCLVRNT